MNSAHAFSYAVSGSYTENQMQKYAEYVNNSTQAFQQAGGWLAQQATNALEGFNNYMTSRAWEMGKRLLGKSDGDYVGRFEVGYLGSVAGLQGAQGFMRDYIMAHEGLHQDYLDDKISGYDGVFSPLNTGIGAENIFWRRAMNGLMHMETKDDVTRLKHAHYLESAGGGLSFRERVDVQKTWAAVGYHRTKGLFDITSETNKALKGAQPPADVE
jgi:hypothetical protein